MDNAQVQQLLDTVKTWNININDATTQKLAERVLPLAQQYMWLHFVEQIIVAVMIIGSLLIVGRVALKILTSKS